VTFSGRPPKKPRFSQPRRRRDLYPNWLNDPELSSAVIDLTHEDQKAVIESVLLELAERRAPRAQ
jgi:hypothetical protein